MLKRREIVKAIHEGVLNAHRLFERASNRAWAERCWMSDSNLPRLEGLVVSHIFRSISIHEDMGADETPILELPFSYIDAWTGAAPQGRPRRHVSPGRRVDLALLNKRDQLIHVIEVKQKWDQETAYADVKKLRDILITYGPRNGGTLKSAFLAVYWKRQNRPSLEEKLKDVQEEVRGLLEREVKKQRMGLRFSRDVRGPVTREDGREWEYGSHVIELHRTNRSKSE